MLKNIQHSKRKLVSPRSHVISSKIMYIYIKGLLSSCKLNGNRYIPHVVLVPVSFLILLLKLQFLPDVLQKLLVCRCFVGQQQTEPERYLEECYCLHKICKLN